MSDVSPYGVHQHAAPGAVRAHTIVGEPQDHQTTNQIGSSVASFSTAPYKGGPKVPTPTVEPLRDGPAVCLFGGCNGWAMKDSPWCRWHRSARK